MRLSIPPCSYVAAVVPIGYRPVRRSNSSTAIGTTKKNTNVAGTSQYRGHRTAAAMTITNGA